MNFSFPKLYAQAYNLFDKDKDKAQAILEHACEQLETDVLNIGEVTEKWVEQRAELRRCAKNTQYIDFTNGVQLKSAKPVRKKKSYVAYIAIPKCRTRDIFSIVLNPYSRQVYFFFINKEYYQSNSGNTLSISFNRQDDSPSTSWMWNCELTESEFIDKVKNYSN